MPIKLSELQTSATITNVTNDRLSNMGFVVGAKVTLLRRKRGCMHVRVGMTEWAIRESTANFVEVDHVSVV